MQAKKRYVLVLMCCAFLALGYFGSSRLRQHGAAGRLRTRTRSYLEDAGRGFPDEDLVVSPKQRRAGLRATLKSGNCTLHTCFDASRCARDFRVFVYPDDPPVSATYRKILSVIRDSRYATPDPARACLFVLGTDTLDRDPLSPDYVPDMQARIDRVPHWNNGRNHVIFNLYSGSWPDYAEHNLGFDLGEAILAKASMSTGHFRPGFDVSLPLFSKTHPERGSERGHVDLSPGTKKYLLVFKGKRYLYGIGSETRNSLYHLHNGKDIILLTTCKHGKKWKEMKDPRCELENKEYDRFDYQVLLSNATFCLVPRGRRLGSFRFLEALQAGCVPVLLSNGWELPFGEAIQWSKAIVFADERLLLQVPDIVRSISPTRVHAFRQQTQVLWDNYFSSVEKIVSTTLEIIRERLYVTAQRSSFVWNTHPGALPILPQFSDVLRDFPFYLNALGAEPGPKFTAVVYVSMAASSAHSASSPLLRLVKTVAKSAYAARIVVIWNSESVPASSVKWPPSTIPINVIQAQHKTISSRFFPHPLIQTDAVLSLDEDVLLTTEEVDFAFRVWQSFPERIVGYPARSHFWDDSRGCWGYTSKWTNDYSIVLTGAAFYHRYYHFLYTHYLSHLLHKIVDQSQNCEDILLNFLVSHVTRLPPIKVTQRKQYKETMISGGGKTYPSPWNDPDHFMQRQTCINSFAKIFGYMPLVRSNTRLDPVLFKDPVSNLRKKYRRMEITGS
ncbi:exostosin-1-like [Uloborus diversus]|uniref:exostosin-1-like n=1 Tax=Uloborus diversus TaxID=327109 RepID=UPI00240921E2|nr:exostosin-1-like [Uloborus diversus]